MVTSSFLARTTHGRRARDQRGAVAVELAFVLPILVLLLFGIVEFGRGYNAKVSLQGAVREGARILALEDEVDPTDAVLATTTGAAPSLNAADIAVTTDSSTYPCTVGEQVSVTATYPFEYSIPFFGEATRTISATGVMRCAG